jgi:hypothetical protein
MGLLYGPAGRLAAENGGFRRGQRLEWDFVTFMVNKMAIGGGVT